ncbi:MAG: hypothetical protein KA248_06580 [Kiritimatiellae bacterium]|nr:hypothetical protein [Kiritimatiellia bacterium]
MRNACKKAVWSGAALLCGLLVLSSSGQSEVYSVNVVGFQKLTASSSTLTMLSVPFDKTTNNLDQVIGAQLTSGKSEGVADQIIIWDASLQKYQTYWLKSTDNYWYDLSNQRATNVYIDTEDGFYIRNRASTNRIVVVSGDVPEDSVITNVLVPGLSMVSYPFSTSVNINDSKLTNGLSGKSEGVADQVSVWNTATKKYEIYWLKQSDKKWYTLANVLATNVYVGSGAGFFYRNRNSLNFNWAEARPYTF